MDTAIMFRHGHRIYDMGFSQNVVMKTWIYIHIFWIVCMFDSYNYIKSNVFTIKHGHKHRPVRHGHYDTSIF